MQEKLTVARPYAQAAFAFASERGRVDSWSAMLAKLAAAMEDHALVNFIGHPKIRREQIMDVVADILGPSLDDEGRNFIEALIDAERLILAPQIAELFEQFRARAAGFVSAQLISAYALSDTERGRIESAIRARLGKECKVEVDVDPSLIGGAVVKIGDSVIDLSLRGRLGALAQILG